MEKTQIPFTLNILFHLLSFSKQIFHLKNIDVYTFWGGGEVWESMFCALILMLTYINGP